MKLALCIPHAAHKPGRHASLTRVLGFLGAEPSNDNAIPVTGFDQARVFSEREPHWKWSLRMWRWGLESGADWLVQLQDDTVLPGNLTAVIEAMLTSMPANDGVIGLMGVHPVGREIARLGGRYYRTRAWLLGNGYMLSRKFLERFIPWVEANEARARVTCEDSFINAFCCENGLDVWHPLPSLVDHDTSIPSTWMLDGHSADNHAHRRAIVSWKDYSPRELADPDFWKHPGQVKILVDALGPICWFCLNEPAFINSADTGCCLGQQCVAKVVSHACGLMGPGGPNQSAPQAR
jgi:hypothetical protein